MSNWIGYKNCNTFEFTSQLSDALSEIEENIKTAEIVWKNEELSYWNIPASFDIETSSFIQTIDGEPVKHACMYIWQMGINGTVIYGRWWEEFIDLCAIISNELELGKNRRLIIYVQNLSYEFQFIRKWFKWSKVFAPKRRRPIYAITGGIEFRCSYFLSNYALAYIGDNLLHKYPVKKLVGNLDYNKIRHSETPLTKDELDYCINDVKVVMSYIQEKIEQDGDITKIPLTNTGYVRNYCRKECFYSNITDEDERKKNLFNYRALMKSLIINNDDEYEQLKRAFMGGFTHASALHSTEILEDVGSADLTSSYPFVIVAEYFPMTPFEYIGKITNSKLLDNYLQKYCCLFDIKFINLRPKVLFENILSCSRCYCKGKVSLNNGRIISADECMTTLTELDYKYVQKFYTWDSAEFFTFRISHRGYLPKALILAILNLYQSKTSLKGVQGKEVEYMVSKNMINAGFGMMVTDIVRDEFVYDAISDEWFVKKADPTSQLTGYNKSFNRFLYYGWGTWVTAHARCNLYSAIYEFGEDYVYSDTDSIKGINFDSHNKYFEDYNHKVFQKLLTMCNHYNIPFNMCKPKTNKGIEKLLGVWEREEGYKKFKTVGAKRYMYTYPDGKFSFTISGVNKKYGVPYLLEKYNNDIDMIFETFGDGFYIPPEKSGNFSLSYIDNNIDGEIIDYFGTKGEYHEKSCIHMSPKPYFMSLLQDYLDYLSGIEHIEY